MSVAYDAKHVQGTGGVVVVVENPDQKSIQVKHETLLKSSPPPSAWTSGSCSLGIGCETINIQSDLTPKEKDEKGNNNE